ncbi:MAG: hypothetical protein KAZ26_23530 [Caldilineaceae bacterium]|nr:hypothetical protein [Caldilineaceae bacterium]
MKTKDVRTLKPGDRLLHGRYGPCVVEEILWSGDSLFGIVIFIDNPEGASFLLQQSGGDVPRLLEAQVRNLKAEDLES